jgi:hypothetical protein
VIPAVGDMGLAYKPWLTLLDRSDNGEKDKEKEEAHKEAKAPRSSNKSSSDDRLEVFQQPAAKASLC